MMQSTDLNAHAAPWQGPRPTGSAAGRNDATGASRAGGQASEEARPTFVMRNNVTNAHAAAGERAAATFGTAAPFAAPRAAAARHHWWGPVQPHVTARAQWGRRPAPAAARPDAPTPATPAVSPPSQGQSSAGVSPAATFAPTPASRTNAQPPAMELGSRQPSEQMAPQAASQQPSSNSLIFDGRIHRQTKQTPAPAPATRVERSGSSSSDTSSKSEPAKAKVAGPLLGSESILFDPSSIVRPSVSPANFASAPTALLSTPPVNGQELTMVLPSPMPSAVADDATHARVVIDVEDLLDGLNLQRTPDM